MTWSSPPSRSSRLRQLKRLTAAGLPVKWVAFDEVYGRSRGASGTKAAKAGLSYVAIIPCDYQVTLPSGTVDPR